MQDSIFTKIINKDVPCHKVFEDEKTIAIMDLHPIQDGMVLVISKSQVDHFMDLEPDDYHALMSTVQNVARAMHKEYPDCRIGVQIEGFEVPHAHVKLFPIRVAADFHAYADESEPDHDGLAEQAARISARITS